MSLLVVDARTGYWSTFDQTSLSALKSGSGSVRVDKKTVTKAGLIVSSLPKRRGFARREEVKSGLTAAEKKLLVSLQRFQPLWLISDRAFFETLPIEVVSGGVSDLWGGFIHTSLLEEAGRDLGQPTSQLNVISLYLDDSSSAVATRGGVPVEVSTQIGPQPDLVSWSEMRGDLAQILSRPKLRLNPKFQLALRVYFHDLILLVGGYAGLLGRLDAVILSGALGKENLVREELLKRLPFLRSVNILVGEATPLPVAAEILHRL